MNQAVLSAVMRSTPEDFVVEEALGFEPTGQGEHLFMQVEKREANTAWVAEQLARWAGVHESAVGYAGLKDRHAVTRQAFTLHLPGREAPALDTLAIEGVRVLSCTRHQRKLPRGALQGNRFALTLRQLQGEPDAIQARLEQIAKEGVPNRFGRQRFGHGGGNVASARALFKGRRASRAQRSIYLSAARAELFNRILDQRIALGTWNTAMAGEVFMLDGSHSVFGPVALDETLTQRLAHHDIHPTGALWGVGPLRSTEAVAELETAVAAADTELSEGLARAGLKQERRALRVAVRQLQWTIDNDQMHLSFSLPAGSYATAVLDALGEVHDRKDAT